MLQGKRRFNALGHSSESWASFIGPPGGRLSEKCFIEAMDWDLLKLRFMRAIDLHVSSKAVFF
ncbi:protein of unknown function [Methylocella tundrae]|uniref:Uncharacterized protein n=1 Tax=Methylocella tundrae TaxID=227605 RepID=A0A4U8Z083_METTU|nr:protein of unknown function [Methylocella tundrae]